MNGAIATARAQTMPWWDDSLLLDKRDKKFWVWRAKI